MGLSTLYGNIFMFAIFLTAVTVLSSEFADYMGRTSAETRAQGEYLKDRLDTSISVQISTSTSDSDVRFYVVNDGKTPLEPDCTDFYLDRKWVNRSDMEELVLSNTTFRPGVWDPDETLKMRMVYDTGDGLPHEGRVVTCNGVSASRIFYKVT